MLSWKPHPRTKHHVDRKPVAKLWPIYILKIAVGRHLGFYRTGNSDIRSADAENPYGLEPNMEWIVHRLRYIHL